MNSPTKPKLQIQVDSMLQSNSGMRPETSDERDLTFKSSSGNTLEVESSSKTFPQNTSVSKLGPSPLNQDSIVSKDGLTSSGQKIHRFEMSKQVQILRSKLNIPCSESQESAIRAKQDSFTDHEEEKGEIVGEEFDQSRPMTTRIYDDEDDQNLHMQYKNIQLMDKGARNKHMSVEAGLERQSKDDN